MTYMATTGRLLGLLAVLFLYGCGDTRIAFCSGGEEFCGTFFEDNFGDDEHPEEPEPSPPRSALEQATAIGLQTPGPVANAIATQQMGQLLDDDPQLAALWITAAALGHAYRADPVTTTQYLDQTRAWLHEGGAGLAKPELQPAMLLLAEFTEHRDPGLAAIAQSFIGAPHDLNNAPPNAYEVAVEVLRATTSERCCSHARIAAAAVVLCAAQGDAQQSISACRAAALRLNSL